MGRTLTDDCRRRFFKASVSGKDGKYRPKRIYLLILPLLYSATRSGSWSPTRVSTNAPDLVLSPPFLPLVTLPEVNGHAVSLKTQTQQ